MMSLSKNYPPTREELLLVRLLRGPVKNLNVNGRHLNEVPRPICRLTTLTTLEMKNNKLKDFPDYLSTLKNVRLIFVCCACFIYFC